MSIKEIPRLTALTLLSTPTLAFRYRCKELPCSAPFLRNLTHLRALDVPCFSPMPTSLTLLRALSVLCRNCTESAGSWNFPQLTSLQLRDPHSFASFTSVRDAFLGNA